MGSADCRAYARNKRGIAGSLIWVNFDRNSLLNLFAKARGRFVANVDDIRPAFQDDGFTQLSQTALFNSGLVRTSGPDVSATIDQLDVPLNSVSGFKTLAQAWYADQILPFTPGPAPPSSSRHLLLPLPNQTPGFQLSP